MNQAKPVKQAKPENQAKPVKQAKHVKHAAQEVAPLPEKSLSEDQVRHIRAEFGNLALTDGASKLRAVKKRLVNSLGKNLSVKETKALQTEMEKHGRAAEEDFPRSIAGPNSKILSMIVHTYNTKRMTLPQALSAFDRIAVLKTSVKPLDVDVQPQPGGWCTVGKTGAVDRRESRMAKLVTLSCNLLRNLAKDLRFEIGLIPDAKEASKVMKGNLYGFRKVYLFNAEHVAAFIERVRAEYKSEDMRPLGHVIQYMLQDEEKVRRNLRTSYAQTRAGLKRKAKSANNKREGRAMKVLMGVYEEEGTYWSGPLTEPQSAMEEVKVLLSAEEKVMRFKPTSRLTDNQDDIALKLARQRLADEESMMQERKFFVPPPVAYLPMIKAAPAPDKRAKIGKFDIFNQGGVSVDTKVKQVDLSKLSLAELRQRVTRVGVRLDKLTKPQVLAILVEDSKQDHMTSPRMSREGSSHGELTEDDDVKKSYRDAAKAANGVEAGDRPAQRRGAHRPQTRQDVPPGNPARPEQVAAAAANKKNDRKERSLEDADAKKKRTAEEEAQLAEEAKAKALEAFQSKIVVPKTKGLCFGWAVRADDEEALVPERFWTPAEKNWCRGDVSEDVPVMEVAYSSVRYFIFIQMLDAIVQLAIFPLWFWAPALSIITFVGAHKLVIGSSLVVRTPQAVAERQAMETVFLIACVTCFLVMIYFLPRILSSFKAYSRTLRLIFSLAWRILTHVEPHLTHEESLVARERANSTLFRRMRVVFYAPKPKSTEDERAFPEQDEKVRADTLMAVVIYGQRERLVVSSYRQAFDLWRFHRGASGKSLLDRVVEEEPITVDGVDLHAALAHVVMPLTLNRLAIGSAQIASMAKVRSEYRVNRGLMERVAALDCRRAVYAMINSHVCKTSEHVTLN